ncbi:MAG: methionyl-tRNA formyltransferase [Candidatus Shapirobacteria bacterium]
MIKTFFYGRDWRSHIVLEKIKNNPNIQLIDQWQKADLGLLASYGKILTDKEIKHFRHGILNVHPSLLPKYRGGKPAAAAILNRDKESGVTIIKLIEKVDAGPIIGQVKEKVLPTDTSENLEKKLFKLGGKLLNKVLADYLAGKIIPQPQNEKNASWAPKLKKEGGKIDWTKSPAYLERFIRAMTPWPGAYTRIKIGASTKYLKILKGHLEKNKLVLDLVQLEGKKPVSFKQFLEGYPQVSLPADT